MSDLAAYLGAAILVAWAASMSVLERHGARRPIRRAGLVFALCEGCSLALLAPRTVSALTDAGLPGPAVVAAGDAVRALAISFLMMLACALNPRGCGRRPGCQLAMAVLVQAAMLALFVIARPRLDAEGELMADPPGRWPLALRVAVFAGYAIWALTELFLALLPQARLAGTRALRWGVRLFLVAIVFGMLWSLWSYDDILDVLRHGELNGSEDVLSNVLGAVCASLVVTGALLGRSGATLSATARWLRLYRCYRLLGPLWTALRAAMPYSVPQASRPRMAGRLRLEFALYRRVIEIHDGRLVLRPYHHPAVASWVAAASDSGPSDALVEAATIAAALENMRRQRRFTDSSEAPAGDPGLVLTDLDSEVLWLSRVAWAFSRSPVIPAVLERLRAEEG
ncbi:MAB_1171c family putative transporter [Catenulispora yoronensis]